MGVGIFLKLNLDGPAIRNANRGDSPESTRANRLAEKKTIFITFERFERIASNLRFAILSSPKCDSHKKKGSAEAIGANQAIRANLQLDSRESGHLSACTQ